MVPEKELFCWIGASRDGRRNGGGTYWAPEDFSSLLTTGRIAIDVDMAH